MLTDRQQEVFDFIQQFRAVNGYTPTVREVAGHLGVQVHAAHGHMKALEKKGYLQREAGKGRALRMLETVTNEQGSVFSLPLVARIPAGAAVSVEENANETLEVTPNWFGKGSIVAVRVMGESMAGDAIADGDIAILQLQKTAQPRDIVAVRIAHEEITLKRLRKKGSIVELVPSNPDFPVREVPAEHVEIVGKLVGIIRKT